MKDVVIVVVGLAWVWSYVLVFHLGLHIGRKQLDKEPP